MRILHPLAASGLFIAGALATPSGLNNIPIADTTPQGTFVLQPFSTIGGDRDTDFNLGFKTGFDAKAVRFEIGAASHLHPGEAGPLTLHGKIAIPFGTGLPTFALGLANVTFTDRQRRRAGDIFGYAVLSQDFGWFRIHGGCAFQNPDALPFYGIDKTFRYTKSAPDADPRVNGDKTVAPARTTKTIELFTLRGDAILQHDNRWLYSAGVLIPVCRYFVLETWGNFPDLGGDASLTIKGNFVFNF